MYYLKRVKDLGLTGTLTRLKTRAHRWVFEHRYRTRAQKHHAHHQWNTIARELKIPSRELFLNDRIKNNFIESIIKHPLFDTHISPDFRDKNFIYTHAQKIIKGNFSLLGFDNYYVFKNREDVTKTPTTTHIPTSTHEHPAVLWHHDMTYNLGDIHNFTQAFYWDPTVFYTDLKPHAGPHPGPDIKIPWELSRFNFVYTLGIAHQHWCTENKQEHSHTGPIQTPTPIYIPTHTPTHENFKNHEHSQIFFHQSPYYQAFYTYTRDWIDNNPYLLGVNWVCPMEVAIRAINFIWGFYFFAPETLYTDDQKLFWQEVIESLYDHKHYLENNWETSDRPNNHYLADLVGYLYLCVFLNYNNRLERDINICLEKITQQYKHQILPDGTSYEGSLYYHKLVTQFLLHVLCVCHAQKITLSPKLYDLFTRMNTFLCDCSDHKGNLVQIGDNDSGYLVVPFYRAPCPIIMSHAHACSSHMLAPDQACVTNTQDTNTHTQEPQSQEPNTPVITKTYKYFGLSIIKTSTQIGREKNIHLTLRHPTYTSQQPTGHFHQDQLSLTLSIDGIPIIVDPGSYCYTSNAHERNYFRSFYQHSGCFINNSPGYTPDISQEPHVLNHTRDLFTLSRTPEPVAPDIFYDAQGNICVTTHYTHLTHAHTLSHDTKKNIHKHTQTQDTPTHMHTQDPQAQTHAQDTLAYTLTRTLTLENYKKIIIHDKIIHTKPENSHESPNTKHTQPNTYTQDIFTHWSIIFAPHITLIHKEKFCWLVYYHQTLMCTLTSSLLWEKQTGWYSEQYGHKTACSLLHAIHHPPCTQTSTLTLAKT
jgi:hypothetical protein